MKRVIEINNYTSIYEIQEDIEDFLIVNGFIEIIDGDYVKIIKQGYLILEVGE